MKVQIIRRDVRDTDKVGNYLRAFHLLFIAEIRDGR